MEQQASVACDASGRVSAPSVKPSPFRRRVKRTGKRTLRLTLQFALLIGVYALGCMLAAQLPIQLPGNIVGMVLLLVLLGTGLLKSRQVGAACTCLIDNMSLFFIPAGVAIMGCFSMLEGSALKFALVCVVTTVLVFLATSYTVIAVSRLMARRSTAKDDGKERTVTREEA